MKRLVKEIINGLADKVFQRLGLLRGNIHRGDRYAALHLAWGHVFSNLIEGDYVEFGVYSGNGAVASILNYSEFGKWVDSQKSSP